jgi:hypothetical protein
MHCSQLMGFAGASLVALAFGFSPAAHAGVVTDGTLGATEGYGSPAATQTINTGFGDSTVGDGTSAGGSELDAAYGVVSGGNLNVFLAGNFESNGNHVNLFVSDGRAGQSVLNLPGGNTMSTMNGSTFSPGFLATYALDANDFQGTTYVEEYTLTAPGTLTGAFVGPIPLTGGIGTGKPGQATIGWNDTNAAGVNGNSGTAANPSAANAVNTGMEVSIPLSVLGNPSGPLLVLASINGGGDNFLSNQFLPGLPVGTGNVGGGGPFTGPTAGSFNFGTTPGEFFVVGVPEPASLGLLTLIGVSAARRRRAV